MQHFFDYSNQVAIYAIYAVSLNVLLGYAGQLSIAHAAFGAIGGYTAAYLAANEGWSFLPTLLVGFIGATILGILVSLPALYLSQQFLILLTLALSTVVIALVGTVPALGGSFGLPVPATLSIGGHQFAQPSQFFVPLIIIVVVVCLTCWRLVSSPFGRVLRGIRDDDSAARGVGKRTVYSRMAVFGITAGMAGVAGVMLVFYNGASEPDQFNLQVSMTIIAMVIIGGSGNLLGSILGAAIVTLMQPFLQQVVNLDATQAGSIRLAIYGGLIIVFLILRPEGLIPEGLGRRLKRRGSGSVALATAIVTERPAATEQVAPTERLAAIDRPALSPAPPRAEPDSPRPPSGEDAVLLVAKGLRKRFGGVTAADDLGLSLARGRVTGLVGPNGAGKTTVFNLMTGVIMPESGTVTLRGQDITGWSADRVTRAGMSRTYQNVRIFSRMSVLENVSIAVPSQAGEQIGSALFRPRVTSRREREVREAALRHLGFVGLADKADEVSGSLPFGEQKLLALARLLATEADVLLLDEPSSGIDMDAVDRMLELIGNLTSSGKAVCVVEHNLHVLERIADWVYFMEAGKITAEGTLSELVTEPRLAEVYFGSA